MKQILTFNLLIPLLVFCQNNIENELMDLYSKEQFKEIINYEPYKDWNAKAYYYRAMAHYMTYDDDNTIKFMDLAIQKGPVDHDMFYYKGMTLFYKKEYTQSLPLFKKAIQMLPDEPAFYKSTGEVFYKLNQVDSAYAYLKKATTYENCKIDAYSLLAEISYELKKNEESYQLYEKLIDATQPGTEEHHRYLYNFCLIQQLDKKYVSAQSNLKRLLSIYQDDYQAKSKLIQVLIAQGKYDSIAKHRDDLYQAYNNNKLPPEFNERFCFEQFDWKDHKVFAYENFKEHSDTEESLFFKHRYFVFDSNGDYLCEVNSESSLAVRMIEEIDYVLALKDKSGFKTFWQFSFKETNYKTMTENVLKILNGEAKPGSSTTIN